MSSITIGDEKITYTKLNSKAEKKVRPFRVFSVLYRDGTEKVVFAPDTLDELEFKLEEMRSFVKGEQEARLLYKNYVVPSIGFAVGAASGTYAIYGLVGPPLFSTFLGYLSPNIEKQHTFKISGDAAESLGIKPGKYLNEVTSGQNVQLKKDQTLRINSKNIRFKSDTDIDSAVSIINSKFNCSRVRALNNDGKLKLYKASSTALISDDSYKEGYSKRVREKRITSGLIAGFIGFAISVVTLTLVEN